MSESTGAVSDEDLRSVRTFAVEVARDLTGGAYGDPLRMLNVARAIERYILAGEVPS